MSVSYLGRELEGVGLWVSIIEGTTESTTIDFQSFQDNLRKKLRRVKDSYDLSPRKIARAIVCLEWMQGSYPLRCWSNIIRAVENNLNCIHSKHTVPLDILRGERSYLFLTLLNFFLKLS